MTPDPFTGGEAELHDAMPFRHVHVVMRRATLTSSAYVIRAFATEAEASAYVLNERRNAFQSTGAWLWVDTVPFGDRRVKDLGPPERRVEAEAADAEAPRNVSPYGGHGAPVNHG